MGRGQRRNRSHKKVKIDNNDDDDNQTVYGSSSTSITAAAEKEEDPPLPTTTTPIAATKPTAHPQQQPSNPTTTSPPYLDVTYWKGTTTSASDVCSSGSSSSFGDDIPKSLTAEQFYCDTTTDDDDDKHTPNHPPTVHHSITTDDAWTSLFSLWHSLPLHQNHNRFHNTNRNTSIPIHDPTPIQLQAWAILLPLGQQQQDRGGSTSMADVPNAPPPTIRITTTNTTTNVKKTNLVQISPTGSGKTFAYGLPLIVESAAAHCRLKKPSSSTARRMTGLVLVPTRELARQVQSTLQSAIRAWSSASAPRLDNSNAASRNSSSRTEVSVVAWYGGVEKRAQLQEFRTMLVNHNGGGSRSSSAIVGGGSAVIVAATTGRFLDLLQHIFGHVSDSDRAALAPQSQISSSSSSSSSRVALDDERKNMQKQLSSNLMTIVLDEADRLAINKDLFEQTSKILQYLRAPSSTSGNQHDIHSQEEANNNSNSSSRVDIRMVLCSATWPDRATQPWNEWVDAPCISIKVDAVRVHSAARSSSSAVADTVGIEASLKVEDVNAQESYKRRDLLLSRIPSNLTQVLHVCAEHKKPKKLVSTLEAIHQSNTDKRNRSLGIVFFATIKTLQYISTLLMKEKALQCTQLHSSLNQSSRDQAVRDFTSGKIPILLATDIAARGIHIPNVLFVINYDFPTNLEQYVHRCGRAGRGISNNIEETVTTSRETGKIYSFFTRNLAPMAEDLIALLESNQQWIDPNLRLLIRKSSSSSKHAQKKREISDTGDARASNETVAKSSHNETNQDNSEGDDDPFVALSANRIVLKRALHVSDASENEDDSEEEC